MPAKNLGTIFDIYDILTTTLDDQPNSPGVLGTNTITCQLGNAITGSPFCDNAEFWGPAGLLSIPSPITSNSPQDAAQCIAISRADQNIVIATRDTRNQNLAGKIQPGETILYAGGTDGTGAGKVVLKADGTVTIFTKYKTNGDGMYLQLSPTDGFIVHTPFGRLSLDVSGFNVFLNNGAGMLLGSVGGLPAPADSFSSCFKVTASSASLDAPLVTLGPSVSSGGTGIMFGAVYGVIPPVAPGVPLLGEGIGAVVVNASTSTGVFVVI